MKGTLSRLIAASALIVAIVGISGCATAARSIDSSQDLAVAATGAEGAVAFGKFQLIRNGEAASIGNGLLSTSAVMTLHKAGEYEPFVGQVGADGDFAWALEPGFYRVSSIRFDNRGERVQPITNFTFSVDRDHAAVYVGTITLEATFESGYYGLNGIVNGYTVSNDCASDCAPRLEQLGLDVADATISLMYEQSQLASRN
jgi:hypothetical protein